MGAAFQPPDDDFFDDRGGGASSAAYDWLGLLRMVERKLRGMTAWREGVMLRR